MLLYACFILFWVYFREGCFQNTANQSLSFMTSDDGIPDDSQSEWNARANQLCQMIQSTDALAKATNHYNVRNDIFSFEELADLIPPTATFFVPTNTQIEKAINTSEVNAERQVVSELLFLHEKYDTDV